MFFLAAVTVRYDTIRSDDPSDFVTGVTCVESDDTLDTLSTDTATPTSGAVFHYIVRPENDCASDPACWPTTTLRTARNCP